MIGSDFEAGSLAGAPGVEDEPDAAVADLVDVLADAEAIVAAAAPDIVADIDRAPRTRRSWWRRRKGDDDGDDFRLSNR